MSITVLKYNVPWGPFTREQINDGISRGDFTLRYLAHAPGLKEWHPLGEVLDHVERNSGERAPLLPPVPLDRPDLPPIPTSSIPITEPPRPAPPVIESKPESKPPSLPPLQKPAPVVSESIPKPEIPPVIEPEIERETASIFRRGVAFFIDAAILFLPLGLLWILWALAIELPDAWHKVSHQVRMDQWEFLSLTMSRLFWLDMVGFGWLYGAGMESSPSQATIGKKWAGVIVTDLQGHRISFIRASGRYAAKYLSALPAFLGFIMALFSSRNLTLHDRLSDTRVVKK